MINDTQTRAAIGRRQKKIKGKPTGCRSRANARNIKFIVQPLLAGIHSQRGRHRPSPLRMQKQLVQPLIGTVLKGRSKSNRKGASDHLSLSYQAAKCHPHGANNSHAAVCQEFRSSPRKVGKNGQAQGATQCGGDVSALLFANAGSACSPHS